MALGALPAKKFHHDCHRLTLELCWDLIALSTLSHHQNINCGACMWHSAAVNIFWAVKVLMLQTINYSSFLFFPPALHWFQLPWQAKVSFSSWGKILNDSDKHSWGTWLIHLMKHKLLCFWNKSAAGLSKGWSLRAGAQDLSCTGEEASADLVQV